MHFPKGKTFFAVGPLPPPVHGAALVTDRAIKILEQRGLRPKKLTTSPFKRGGILGHHFGRMVRYGYAALHVLSSPHRPAVYLAPSGRAGLVYDLALVVISSLRRANLILHHHSFSYINQQSLLMRAILNVMPSNQLHVFLCEHMKRKMKNKYKGISHSIVITNLAFWPANDALQSRQRQRQALSTIGFLSNIVSEKGIDRFLQLMTSLRNRHSTIRAKIAGPIKRPETEEQLTKAISRLGGIEYVGAVHGAAKDEFFDAIDFLIFPTRYRDEAEPLVIIEAQMAGVPVAASDRGCIKCMLDPAADVLLDADGSDLMPIVDRLLTLEQSPEIYREIAEHVINNTERRRIIQSAARSQFEKTVIALIETGSIDTALGRAAIT